MKKNKRLTITLILAVIIIFVGIYIFAISGEKLDERETLWLFEIPIAHRGFDNGDIPENSMEAFQNAIDRGYGIELDVQLTKDNEVIVFHDTNLKRLTGDDRDVKDITYEELKSLNLENTKEKIPTLREVIELVNNQVPLIVEIKEVEDIISVTEKTYNVMKDYKGRYAIQSFNPFALEWLKNNAGDVIRGQISGNFKDYGEGLKFYEKYLLKNLLLNFKSRPNFIAYELEGNNNISLKVLHSKGYPSLAWNVKSEDDMEKAYESFDNIIFDNTLP